MTDTTQPKPGIRRPVSRPATPLPPGSWDCHAHVFGPFDRFPVSAERRYEPPLAPAEHYFEMLDTVGFENGVIVHASAKGFNMANVADTLARRPANLVGIAVPAPDADDAAFAALHEQGFRGVRITEAGRHTGRTYGTLYFDDLAALAPRLREMGWHAQIWGRGDLVLDRSQALSDLGLPLIFDHLGYPSAPANAADPNFRRWLDWVADHGFWVKATPVRVSKTAPDYPEAEPIFRAIVKRMPDRVVFGSDWPYLSLDADPPDVGRIVDLTDRWLDGDETLRRKLYADNPRRFYRGA